MKNYDFLPKLEDKLHRKRGFIDREEISNLIEEGYDIHFKGLSNFDIKGLLEWYVVYGEYIPRYTTQTPYNNVEHMILSGLGVKK